jgi:hypothetical protein
MAKKKWRRVSLADLADRETQEKILGVIAQATGAQTQDPHKRPSETAQVER